MRDVLRPGHTVRSLTSLGHVTEGEVGVVTAVTGSYLNVDWRNSGPSEIEWRCNWVEICNS